MGMMIARESAKARDLAYNTIPAVRAIQCSSATVDAFVLIEIVPTSPLLLVKLETRIDPTPPSP